MHVALSTLVDRLACAGLSGANVIPWSCPVPSFGDVSSARVATVGINPSNREFVDRFGMELDGPSRRFHTLGSLGLACWSDAEAWHVRQIWDSCQRYFLRNPYDVWFKQLDHILGETTTSYYGASARACHLDLIPYATNCKWTNLSCIQRSRLFSVAGDSLALLLRESHIRMLVLNGSSVVAHFQRLTNTRLDKQSMGDWVLPRKSTPSVAGVAYKGIIRSVAGIKLKRELLVVGFNHNIQSSFGVTREVRISIRRWIGQTSHGLPS